VNIFRANTENDIFADNTLVACNILIGYADAEGAHIHEHLAFFHVNLTIEEVHGG